MHAVQLFLGGQRLQARQLRAVAHDVPMQPRLAAQQLGGAQHGGQVLRSAHVAGKHQVHRRFAGGGGGQGVKLRGRVLRQVGDLGVVHPVLRHQVIPEHLRGDQHAVGQVVQPPRLPAEKPVDRRAFAHAAGGQAGGPKVHAVQNHLDAMAPRVGKGGAGHHHGGGLVGKHDVVAARQPPGMQAGGPRIAVVVQQPEHGVVPPRDGKGAGDVHAVVLLTPARTAAVAGVGDAHGVVGHVGDDVDGVAAADQLFAQVGQGVGFGPVMLADDQDLHEAGPTFCSSCPGAPARASFSSAKPSVLSGINRILMVAKMILRSVTTPCCAMYIRSICSLS